MNRFHFRRLLAMLLMLMMLTSSLPLAASAAGEDSQADATTETTVTTEPESTAAVAAERLTLGAEPEENKEWSLDLTIDVKSTPMLSADTDSPTGITVSVTRTSIELVINRVGSSGTAKLYSFDANEYFSQDSISGLSAYNQATGTYICDYTCGTEQKVSFNRYTRSGEDNLYRKYYLLQDGKIVAGPYYATSVSSVCSVDPFETTTKKGLVAENGATIETAKEMNVGNTTINAEICQLILANEDADGNPIDYSGRTDVVPFESNGKTFYFKAAGVQSLDGMVIPYSQAGINVTLVVYPYCKEDTSSYPTSLLYIPVKSNRVTMAINTSNELGREYWVAIMEFLADRYSKTADTGLVNKFIIGNEIDYSYDWNLIMPLKDANGKYQKADLDVYMEEYARTLRLAELATKKYNSQAYVAVSITHNWAENCYVSYKNTGNHVRLVSYAPKDILDWLCTVDDARGSYNWFISQHPYAIGTVSSKPTVTDPAMRWCMPITGDMETSPWITVSNLELLQLYLEQPYTQCNGEMRFVTLNEASIVHETLSSAGSEEAYAAAKCAQAASVAQMYYRAAHLSCIKEVPYFQLTDTTSLQFGLQDRSGNHKPAYNVWKYVDTNKSFDYSNQYLKYLGKDSWLDVMKAVKSDFDWDAVWDESVIMTETVNLGDANRTLNTNKSTYSANETILVTATGELGDVVGLYRASDDPDQVEAIYSYPVVQTSGTITYTSGNTYDLLAYGTISTSRKNDAVLKAGDYQLILTRGDTGARIRKDIKISGNYVFGSTQLSVRMDKTSYVTGENIIVTATGDSSTWVGLYKVGDKYGSGTGTVTSIFWYYVNRPDNGQLSGMPTVLQSQYHNNSSSNSAMELEPGEYILYLFDGSGGNDYNVADSITFQVEGNKVDPLLSIQYKLDDATDGFANGVVTIKKDLKNTAATSCVMYWADENGEPLEGYTALAKFKLTGPITTHRMTEYTVIPEGARSLIAYASDDVKLSDTAVRTDLPENCNYIFQGDVLAEFQSISDIHVTTDSGAVGSVADSNTHFTKMLEDVQTNSPNSIGIFIGGDIANSGAAAEYQKVLNLYYQALNNGKGDLPELHIGIGNHDWMNGNPNGQFQKYAKIYNSNLKEQPENVYYDEVVAGYHFIYLGGEKAGLSANLSDEQIQWFDERMEEITAEDPDKPVFVFLHQSFYNTVSGSLPGEGWNGVVQETALKNVLEKYGQVILQNGHSHWVLDSDSCMYPGDSQLPVALNTAALGYLWSGYNIVTGEFEDGAQGYYVRIYEDKVVFLGRDFETGEWMPSAVFVIQRNTIHTEADAYTISLDDESVLGLDAKTDVPTTVTFESSDSQIASVTSDGTVIPKHQGVVTITITAAPTDTTVVTKKTIVVRIGEASVYRVSGKTRYETSLSVADAMKETMDVEGFDAIVLACGDKFADALSGSYLAAQYDAPIVLASTQNAQQIREYISQNLTSGGTVYLLGGTGALPDSIVNGLTDCVIQRLSGKTRYDTNLAILKEAEVTGGEILVCTGTNYADSLSASAVKKPILLVGDALTEDQIKFLSGLEDVSFTILGGEKSVSGEIAKELESYGKVERIGGKNRFETSALIAEKYFTTPGTAVLAYGMSFPDGLSGGPLAMAMDGPLLLVYFGYESYAQAYMRNNAINTGMVLGGSKLISDKLTRTLFGLDEDTFITTW